MSTTAQADPRTVLLKRVRLSFTEGIKDKQKVVEDGKERHGFNIIIEQVGDDAKAKKYAEENKEKCIAAMKAAGLKEFGDEMAYKSIMEDDPKRLSFRKGERFKNKETGKVYDGYTGNYALSVSGPKGGQVRPKLKDRHKRDVEEKDIETVCYSGTYGDVYVSFYGTKEGGRGIFASAELVRSHQEGASMGRQFVYDDDELDDLEDDDDDLGGGSSSSSAGADLDDF